MTSARRSRLSELTTRTTMTAAVAAAANPSTLPLLPFGWVAVAAVSPSSVLCCFPAVLMSRGERASERQIEI